MSPPPERRLDEKAYKQNLRQYSNQDLENNVLRRPCPTKPNPEAATNDLREGVLGVKEMLRRANKGKGGSARDFTAKSKPQVKTDNIKFN
jgi:hypothetical protein